jgi:hypothetical protein
MAVMVKTELLFVLILCACLGAISLLAVSVERFSEELTVHDDGKWSSAFELSSKWYAERPVLFWLRRWM